MTATKTAAATVLVFAALVASPVQADRIGSRTWRWTTWNVKTGVQPTELAKVPSVSTPPVVPVATPVAPVVAAPVVSQAPAPAPTDNWQNSSRFAVTNPNPTNDTAPISTNSQLFTAIPTASPAPAAAPSAPSADAFINLGNGPYADASILVSGTPQPWYASPIAAKVYGGTPNAQQQADFSAEVLNDVKNIYDRSGLHNISFTTDPSVQATHTLSVVSGVSYDSNGNVIGITNVGQSGLSFIDKLDQVKSVDELATAVAHNVSHELMHAFGVPDHPDHTGEHVDAADATWQTLTDPNATLSSEAVEAILAHQPWNGLNAFAGVGSESLVPQFALETLDPTPVPEPATIALWSVAGIAGVVLHRRARKAAAMATQN